MDWDKLRIFHAVAEAGSFTRAGETLNLSQSAVSRQVNTLEHSLQVPLFHRHARGLKLTEQGEALFKTAREVYAKLALVEAMVTESLERPSGPLRITTTVAFGSIWLTERLKEFIEAYPAIDVSLILREDELNLSMRQADIAIRMTPPRQPDLIQRVLFKIHHGAYASPDYLERYGGPDTLADLDHHRLIAYDETYYPPFSDINWLLDAGISTSRRSNHKRRPVLRVNNIYAMYRAANAGLGIAALPDYLARLTHGLVQVLPELEGPAYQAYFVYPEELRHSKRVAVFRDFLLARIERDRAQVW
jgi:DNA-binding transcriptional LysR family regulator